MCENVFCKGSETIFTNKAFRMLTGLRHYKLLDTEMYDDTVSVKVSSKLSYAKCPVCGRRSHSVHSHYERHLLTLPMYDRAMHITFVARRFRCRNPDCECKRFAEQPSDLVSRYCRRTTNLNQRLTLMSVQMPAMRCEAISRMIGSPISASTSLRLVRSIDTTPDRASVKNICIDDFAFRKGLTYGSLIVDADTGKPLELLNSRDTVPVAEGLKRYTNVATVTRDRAASYYNAIAIGIPGAVQIADRFHLIENCGRHIIEQIRHDFKDIRNEITGNSGAEMGIVRHSPTKQQQERFYTMEMLMRKGLPKTLVAAMTGMKTLTITEYLERGEPLGNRRYVLKDFASHEHIIIQGIKEGKILKDIWQDLWNDGLKMNYVTLLRYMHNSYPEYKSPKGSHKGNKVDNRKALKALEALNQGNKSLQSLPTSMLVLGKLNIYVCNPDYGINKATGEYSKDHILYNQAIARSQILTELREAYISFKQTMKGGDVNALDDWIKKYSESRFKGIAIFAKHMWKDIDAIRNAIRYRYSNGIAEGLNNKIKAIKREMYGRARKDLLEKKLIASALT